jgi:integrase
VPKLNWSRPCDQVDINPVLRRFERWMREKGYREECIRSYSKATKLYLSIVKKANPSAEDAKEYHSNMVESKLARGTVNARAAALKAFYRSLGVDLKLQHLKVNQKPHPKGWGMLWTALPRNPGFLDSGII